MVHPGDDERKQVPVAEVKPDSWGNKTSDTTSKDDTVTLSKSQLRAFLEVIGQVGTLSIAEKPSQVRVGQNEHTPSSAAMPIYGSVGEPQTNGSYAVTSAAQQAELNPTCPLDSAIPSSSKQWASSSVSQQSPTKLSPLSKLEQKRMQWAKEKAEMHDWNPWGKPGAGAPTQRPVASVAPRTDNQLLMVQTAATAAVPYSNSGLNSYQSCLPSPNHYRSVIPTTDIGSHLPGSFYSKENLGCSTSLPPPAKPVPPVFKSSIAFGPGEEEAFPDEFVKKQQWLKDLESQREDQRHRKMAEQDHTRFNSLPDADWLNGNREDLESISVSVDGTVVPYGSENPVGSRTYVRGQGFKPDPAALAQAEERRLKAQEYQQAIRLQMEEKQRRLQEEKERKKREEEELEQRLALERAKMQIEYEQEQKRLKEKEAVEEKKEKFMISAIQEAQAQAEAEKKNRKGSRQKPADENMQVHETQLNSPQKVIKDEVIEQPCTGSQNFEKNKPPVDSQECRVVQQTATVRPIQTSQETISEDADKISLSKELGIQTLQSSVASADESEGYIVNRVLTPSLYRVKGRRGHRKDFGTQTDINYGKWIGDDAELTDQSCTSSISAPLVNRLTRVQHSKPYKASRHHFGNVDSLNERPKWGVNQPSKSFIRMTDRDPHFIKRKKLQELRKQHWEREMATQQSLRNARRSINASYPSLRSRRIKSSSDGTAGFSSSELETSHVRSHSPPRCNRSHLGYRSVCGSAEDVAYYGQSSAYTSTVLPSVHRRDSQSSDNLPSIIGGSEPPPSRLNKRFSHTDLSLYSSSSNLPPMRRKWHSQEAFYPHTMSRLREMSPPVPAVQKRLLAEHSSNSLMSPPVHNRRKWSDQESFDLESVALSHAKSHRTSSDEGNDRDSLSSAESSKKTKPPVTHNPLVHPEVVTGRPTPRQDRILQNLSSLRKGLLQKQRELEFFIRHPPTSS